MTNSGFGQDAGGQDGRQDQHGGNGDGQFGQTPFGQEQFGQAPFQPWQDAPEQQAAGPDGNVWGEPAEPAPWQPEVPQPQWPAEQEEPVYEPRLAAPDAFPAALPDEPVHVPGAGAGSGAGFEEPAQLALGEDDVRLPWLEGEDAADDQPQGMNQGLLLAILGLVALVVIGGAIFWIARDKPDENLVADGGVITAPKEPYKTRPQNPGGEVVAGTGDTSFAVAEGQTRPAQIGGNNAPADAAPAAAADGKPGFSMAGDKPAAPVDAAAGSAGASAKGPGVQVGAYSSREAAEKGWSTLQQRYSGVLSGVQHRVVQGQADIGTVYRLQAVPGDMAAARALSSKLGAAGVESSIKP